MVNTMKPRNKLLIEKADVFLEQDTVVSKPVVAAWGLMNAGKSYLLNMLTNHIQDECFRTNDIRETAELKEFETNDFIFIDTPGLDANSNDDMIAARGAAKADILLFVHQPQGELEKIEIDFLRTLKDSFGQYADKNIILVLSKSDVESAEKIEAIKARMLEQCRDDLGFTPQCYAISGSRFHAGVMQNKDGLVRASHLHDLVNYLDTLHANAGAVQRERQLMAIEALIAEFNQAEEALHEKNVQTKRNIERGFKPFNKAMKDFRGYMTLNLNKYPTL